MYKKEILIPILIILLWYIWLKYNTVGNNYVNKYFNYNKTKNIKIISYNIGLLPYNNKNLDILEKIIVDYDIILIQEFFTNLFFSKKHWLLNFCQKYKYNIVTKEDVSLFSGKLLDGGLVILSKFPIIKIRSYDFNSKSISYDKLANKGFLNAIIQINNKKLSVYNLHNQAFYQKFKNPNFIQIQQLKKLNKFINIKDNYIIVGGDFNIESKYLKKFVKNIKIFDAKCPTIYIKYDKNNIEQNTSCEEEKYYYPYYLDYFLSKNISLKVQAHENRFSDHKYITSEFNLTT